MLRKSLVFFWAAAVALLLVAPGCSPKPGDKCKEAGNPVCLDKATAIECRGGTWQTAGCFGPDGCVSTDAKFSCDVSLAKAGDSCREHDDKRYSCTVDKKTQLRCRDGKWTAMAQCTGDSGCDAKGIFANCADPVSNEGDVCDPPEDAKKKSYTCSVDKKTMLLCKEGKWKAIEQCLAKEGCSAAAFRVRCNGPTAKAGDECDPSEEADYACSSDGKSQLICKAGEPKWTVNAACRGKEGCTSSILGVKCDRSIRELDEACVKDGDAACSVDGKTVLECKDGKMKKAKVCPTACKVDSLYVSCD